MSIVRTPSTPLADQFLRDIARWKIAQHRDTAGALLDELQGYIDQARLGLMDPVHAALTCGISGSWWLHQDVENLRAQP